jgi:hypothetical protein
MSVSPKAAVEQAKGSALAMAGRALTGELEDATEYGTERERLMSTPDSPQHPARVWITRAFNAVEDVVYIGLGLLLAGSALTLLVTGAVEFGQDVTTGNAHMIHLLDRILLVLLVVELLYTVQVSFRAHALVPEPFLLVGLISAMRRVLVLTAEMGELREETGSGVQHFLIELAVLTVLIVALSISLVIFRKSGSPVVAKRGTGALADDGHDHGQRALPVTDSADKSGGGTCQ